jgi:hypothetical protein
MVESASALGRKWIGCLPKTSATSLNNFELSAALHYRFMIPPSLSCHHCGAEPTIGHHEVCRGPNRTQWTINRHNGVTHALSDALSSIKGTRVVLEPGTTDPTSQRRNDLLVYGSARLGDQTTEHDVKVYSVLADKAYSTIGPFRDGKTKAPLATDSKWTKALVQTDRYLNSVYTETKSKPPKCVGKFSPLVFSAGGLIEEETKKTLEGWKTAVEERTWARTMGRMSVGLVKARAKTFEL